MVAFSRGFLDVIKWAILGTRNMLAIHGSGRCFWGIPCLVVFQLPSVRKSRNTVENMS
jgi:hypothetical protein